MSVVYINLHPNYDYAIAIIDGFIDLREYVKNVSWLSWDVISKKQGRQIRISGVLGDYEKARGQHLLRAEIFGQRMLALGVTVKIRNERGDEWLPFVSPNLSEEDLLKAECEWDQESVQERWSRENIEKYNELLKKIKPNNPEQADFVKQLLRDEEEALKGLQDAESVRQMAIKKFWQG